MRQLRVNRNIKVGSVYIIANFFMKGISFFLLPIFTRILTKDDYGIVGTYTSVSNIVTILIGFAMVSTIRAAYTDFKDDIYTYISTIIMIAAVNSVIALGILFVVYVFVQKVFSPVLIVLCIINSFEGYAINCMTNLYMMKSEYKKRTFLMVFPNLFIPFLGILLITHTSMPGYLGRILPIVLIDAVVCAIVFSEVRRKSGRIVSKKYAMYALKVAWLLFFEAIAADILSTFDVVLITYFIGPSESAVYNIAYSIGMVGLSVTGGINSAWIPWYTAKMKSFDYKAVSDVMSQYIDVALVVTLGVMMLSPEVIHWMLTDAYAGAVYFIVPIADAMFMIFLNGIASDVEYYYKDYKSIARNTIIAALLNFVLNIIFIPLYGAVAAAFTTLIAYTVSFLLHMFIARRYNKNLIKLGHYSFQILFLCVGSLAYYTFLENAFLRWGCLFGVLVMVAIKDKEFIRIIRR